MCVCEGGRAGGGGRGRLVFFEAVCSLGIHWIDYVKRVVVGLWAEFSRLLVLLASIGLTVLFV